MASNGLASRCPACQTVFRVVPDQLRVSGGWVRCGRCSEIFNAAESLVDVETGAPRRAADVLPPGADSAEQTDLAAPAPAAVRRAGPGHDDYPAPGELAALRPALTDAPREAEAGQAFELQHDPSSQHQPDPTAAPTSWSAAASGDPFFTPPDTEAGGPAPAQAGALTADALLQDAPAGQGSAAAGELPGFLRQAERARRWRQPRVRAALAALGVLGVLSLVLQVGHQYRDLAAARYPATRPALELMCSALGCAVGPARAINSLAVESSGLVRVEKSSIYKLQVSLRNRAGIDVALPALDLTLTDVQGRLVARKVLRAAELGAQQATVAAGRELALQATLQAKAGEPIAGYTIELFYP